MREIKFRGKRIDTGEWVYGFYGRGLVDVVDDKETYRHFIVVWNPPIDHPSGYFSDIEVDPETVGQYTDCKDKDDRDIYVGDIVKWYEIGGHYMTEAVSWEHVVSGFYPMNSWRPSLPEVVGNTTDNPELLAEAKR